MIHFINFITGLIFWPASWITTTKSIVLSPAAYRGKVDYNDEKTKASFEVDLPGFSKDEISVELDDGTLKVSAEKIRGEGWQNRAPVRMLCPDVVADERIQGMEKYGRQVGKRRAGSVFRKEARQEQN